MKCIFLGRIIGMTSFSSGTNRTTDQLLNFKSYQNSSVTVLLVYKSTPNFQGQKSDFSSFRGKQINEIHTNRNFPKRQPFLPENVLKTR